jgi:hypothetical protein
MLRRGVPSAVTHPHFMVQRLSRGNLLKHGRGSSAPKDTIPTLRRKPPPEPDAHMPSVSEHPIGGDEARHMFRSYAGPFYCPETKSRQSAKTRAGIRGQRMRYPLFGTVPSVCYARTLGRSPATSILRPSRSVARRRPRFERESGDPLFSPRDGELRVPRPRRGIRDISGDAGLVSAGRIDKDTPPLTTPGRTSKSSAMDISSHTFQIAFHGAPDGRFRPSGGPRPVRRTAGAYLCPRDTREGIRRRFPARILT